MVGRHPICCEEATRLETLDTNIDPEAPAFKENTAHHAALVAELRGRIALVKQGGGAEAVAKHKARGKLPARERVEGLMDPGGPFLEFSTLAAWEMYDGDAPGAGLVTGIGPIHGQPCVIVANDATVKGGTY